MNNKNIFLLDADKFFANHFINTINKRGNYSILHFNSFEDARIKIIEQLPSLILIEQKLNGESGLEIIPMIKNINPDCDIIMVSDQNDISIVEAAYNSGVLKYFRKDILLIDHIEGLVRERYSTTSHGWRKLFA
jgi:DNA-binding NtrC family response regulator